MRLYFFLTDRRSQEEKDKYKEKVNSKKKKKDDINKENKDLNDNNNIINKKISKNINSNDNKYPIDKKESKNIKDNKDNKNEKNNDAADINVFEEKGEPVQGNIFLVQYSKKTNDGFILGLENKSYLKREVKLNLEGLELTDEAYKGSDSPTFSIERKSKKVFNAVIKKGYKGVPSYKFEEL